MRKLEKWVGRNRRLYLKGRRRLSRLVDALVHLVFACDIPGQADIDPSVEFIHNGLGVVIGKRVTIRKKCLIYQNVTLGGRETVSPEGERLRVGMPVIEENVKIYAGACVLGPITIGHDSVVGANAVVMHDAPPYSLIVGVPAKNRPLISDQDEIPKK